MRFSPELTFDADAKGAGDFGDLPEWDLSDLYASPEAPEFSRDMEWLEKQGSNSGKIDFAVGKNIASKP